MPSEDVEPAKRQRARRTPSAMRDRTIPGEDGFTGKQRGEVVREEARRLGSEGLHVVTTKHVLDALAARGITFTIRRPTSMIGSVLKSMKEFKRLGPDRFEYVGEISRTLYKQENLIESGEVAH